MSTAFFTVIVATHNRAHLLSRCIDSVLGQSFSDLEMIVCDDGSADDTRQLVERYAVQDKRVRYEYQDNAGANVARNLGSERANGQYLVFLDSDDEALPEWLSKLAELIRTSSCEVACCALELLDQDGRTERVIAPKDDIEGACDTGVYLSGTYAIRKNVFDQVGGFAGDLPAHQHTEFRMRLFVITKARGYRICGTSERLIIAHTHAGPKIRRNAQAKLDATKYILERHRQHFRSERSVASWLAAAGGCAAELSQYAEARAFFGRAIGTYPRYWKNYIRLFVTCLPGVRRLFWRGWTDSDNRQKGAV